VETVLVLGTNYTASVNEDQNSSPGGTITLTAGALAAGFNLVITSDIENLQPTDLTNQGGFYPEVITDALDRATIQIQQLQEAVDRSAKLPITSSADADALVADTPGFNRPSLPEHPAAFARCFPELRDRMRQPCRFLDCRHGGEAGAPAEPHALGTLAEIVDFDQGPDGLLHIACRGAYRFHLLEHVVTREGLLRGQIVPFEDETPIPLPEENRHLKTVLQKVLELESASTGQVVAAPTDAAAIVYRLMERLPLPWPLKLEVLATQSTAKQLEICSFALDQLLRMQAD
jgi:Lon protease-like protein